MYTAAAVAVLYVAAKIDETDIISTVAYKAIDIIRLVAAAFGLAL